MIAMVLRFMFPDSSPPTDWLVVGTGGTEHIEEWNLPDPRPTKDALKSVSQSPAFIEYHAKWNNPAQRRKMKRKQWLKGNPESRFWMKVILKAVNAGGGSLTMNQLMVLANLVSDQEDE